MEFEMTQVVEDAEGSDEADSQDEEHSATLEVQTSVDPPVLQTLHITKRSNVLGRSSSCDVCLNNKVVSQRHLSVELRKDCLFLEDLDSRNKTKIGKERLVPHVRYRLGYEEVFFIGGLRAQVFKGTSHDGVGDADSDTCSESLLPLGEEDAGSILHRDATRDASPGSEASTVAYASPDQDDSKRLSSTRPTEASTSATTVSAADDDNTMDVDDDSSTKMAEETKGGTATNIEDDPPAFSSQSDFTPPPIPDLNFTQQEKSDGGNRDESKEVPAQDADASQDFDLETQVLPPMEDDPGDAEEEPNKSMDFRCAPTQALDEMPAEDKESADFRCAPTQAYEEDGATNTTSLDVSSIVDEDGSFANAPTQALPEIAEEGSSTWAGKEAGGAEPMARLSRRFVVQDAETEQNFEDSVLCEATQGDRRVESEGEEEDVYCGETQEVRSEPLRMQEEVTGVPPKKTVEETPPGSPVQSFIEETPPGSPGVVPESDEEQLSMSNNLSALNVETKEEDDLQESEVVGPVANVTGQNLEVTVVEREEAELTDQNSRSNRSVDSQVETQAVTSLTDVAASHDEAKVLEEAETQRLEAEKSDDDIAISGNSVEGGSACIDVERKEVDQTTPNNDGRDGGKEEETETLEDASKQKEGYEEEVVMPQSQEHEQEEAEGAERAESKVADAKETNEPGETLGKGGEDPESKKEEVAKEKEQGTEEEASGNTAQRLVKDEEDADGSAESKETKTKNANWAGKASKQESTKPAALATTVEEPKATRSSARRNAGKKLGDILSAEKGAWLIESSQGINELSDDPPESHGGRRKSRVAGEGTSHAGHTSSREATPKMSREASQIEEDGGQRIPSIAGPNVKLPDSSESEDSLPVLAYARYSLAESCATQDLPSFSQLLRKSEEKPEEVEEKMSEASKSAKSDMASASRVTDDETGSDAVGESTKNKEEPLVQKVQVDKMHEEEGSVDSDAEVVTGGKKAGRSARKAQEAKSSSQQARGSGGCKLLAGEEPAVNSQYGSRKSSRRALSQKAKEAECSMVAPASEQTDEVSDQPAQSETNVADDPPSSAECMERGESKSRSSQRGKQKVQEETSAKTEAGAVLLDGGKRTTRRAGGRRTTTALPPTEDLDDLLSGNKARRATSQGLDDDAGDFELTPSRRPRTRRTNAVHEESTEPLEAHGDVDETGSDMAGESTKSKTAGESTKSKEESLVQKVQVDKMHGEEGSEAEVLTGGKKAGRSAREAQKPKSSSQQARGSRGCKLLAGEEPAVNSQHGSRKSSRKALSQKAKEAECSMVTPDSEQTEEVSDQPVQSETDVADDPPSSAECIERGESERRTLQRGKHKVQEETSAKTEAGAVLLDGGKRTIRRAGGRTTTAPPPTKDLDDLLSGSKARRAASQGLNDDAGDFELTPSKRPRTRRTNAVQEESAEPLEAPADVKTALQTRESEKTCRSARTGYSVKETKLRLKATGQPAEGSPWQVISRRGRKHSQESDLVTEEAVGSQVVEERLEWTPSKRQRRDSSGGNRPPLRKRQSEVENLAEDDSKTSPKKRQKRGSVTSDKEESSVQADSGMSQQEPRRARTGNETSEPAQTTVSGSTGRSSRIPIVRMTRIGTPKAQGQTSKTQKPEEAMEEDAGDSEPMSIRRATRTRGSKSEMEIVDVDGAERSGTPKSMRNRRNALEVISSQDGTGIVNRGRRLRGRTGTPVADDDTEVTEVMQVGTETAEEDQSSQKTAGRRGAKKPLDIPRKEPNTEAQKMRGRKKGTDDPQSRQSPKARNSRGGKEASEGTDRSETIAKVRKSRGKKEDVEDTNDVAESVGTARSRRKMEANDAESSPRESKTKKSRRKEEEVEAEPRTPMRDSRRRVQRRKDSSREKEMEEEAANTSVTSARSVGRASSSGSRAKKTKQRVLFTGLEDSKGQEIVESLGGVVADAVSGCTHLVTDKFRRTVKALCCVAMGIPIVSIQWLNRCKAAGSFVDHAPYLLRDKAAEKNFGFNLETTLRLAGEERLLRDWSIHVTSHVKPSPEDMKEILTCAGAKYLPKMPQRLSGKLAVVSCQEDKKTYGAAAKKAIPIVSAEFVLTGLLQYKIDTKKYAL